MRGGPQDNLSRMVPRKISKILHLQPRQVIKMKEEEASATIVRNYNKPHMEVASKLTYSLMDEREIQQEKEERYIKEHYKRVAMPHHELQDKILKELQEHGEITLDYIQNRYNQPKDPVKRALQEMCDYDQQKKCYKLKSNR